MERIVQLTIEKMVFGGQGLARLNGKAYFVWNALPGEVVEARLIKSKKDYCEAQAIRILSPSPDRIEPLEAHYLSCSPWQVAVWDKENEWKQLMSIETYRKVGGLDLTPDIFYLDEFQTGYRNKMEYSFTDLPSGKMSLAFFNRGEHGRAAHEGCMLADPAINEVAEKILKWVNKYKIPYRSLKSLIVRSNNLGETIAGLFIKDRLDFKDYPELTKKFLGFQIYFSIYNSPASVPTESLYQSGQDFLTAQILGTKLKFGLLSFFQVHIPVFEKALADMNEWVEKGDTAVDFYSGVGAISLPLRDKLAGAILVDNNSEAIEYAKLNIKLNKAKNFSAECVPAEKITELIESDKVLILDPPRAGLHQDVTAKILAEKPKKILYLSCNLSTQARDLKALTAGGYKIKFSRLYNFFPRTPHVEGLVVLEI
ncbi:MAG: 23S rRNA (uracil-5-)-methyltransferase RumA [Candidatus Magasanikbacteria bacterium RIFOXYD2_FULL_41_14]|uniref:23S rRNA (Uracil-5-)-methyltransferase RumA n=1 Tax=Candidatus Magasanikbacteria bacterium RIFOXYD2_FULL_41_14 TaxID=1798709 RepID=A0A1F6PC85_9BACT|nr:MAG: 23S rRNA (uracil-5-)-methyltransferase RumA [Candidatus Magasanikbacteria bacterium RIFOXYD2_FULL_41_14]